MSYSAADFYNDVTDAFAGAGLIGESLPDDDSGCEVAADRLCTLARVLRTSIYNGLQAHLATLRVEPQPRGGSAALRLIRDARDAHAECGIYPEPPNGPAVDQGFDDWAADLCDAEMRAECARAPDWQDVYDHASTSYALRRAMQAFNERDPVDALADAEMLVALMRAKLAKLQPTCRSCGGGYGEGDGQDGLCFTCADLQYETKASS